MNKDNHQLEVTYHGKKAYRLKIALARVKTEPKQQPNYWDENESEETQMEYIKG